MAVLTAVPKMRPPIAVEGPNKLQTMPLATVRGTAATGDASNWRSRARPRTIAIPIGIWTLAYASSRPEVPCSKADSDCASNTAATSTERSEAMTLEARLIPDFFDEALLLSPAELDHHVDQQMQQRTNFLPRQLPSSRALLH